MQWEYIRITGKLAVFPVDLNKLGKEGWELCAYTPKTASYPAAAIFKRPLSTITATAVVQNEINALFPRD